MLRQFKINADSEKDDKEKNVDRTELTRTEIHMTGTMTNPMNGA